MQGLGTGSISLFGSTRLKETYLPPIARGETIAAFALSEREAGVIRMRFGLGDGMPKTLDQIGDTFGVTRERIRQIESKTMAKLRHPSRSQSLRDYLE